MTLERIPRLVRALPAFYWVLTAAWTGLLGRHLGGLLAYRPEADRAALILLLAGPLVWGLGQGLGQRSLSKAFVRTAALTAIFVALFAQGAGPHGAMLTAPVVAIFAFVSGALGVLSCGTARLLVRLRGGRAIDRFRLARRTRFCLETVFLGICANVFAHLFLWRARIERPAFDSIEYPTAYSRSMDLWTYGYLSFAAVAVLYVFWRAVRLRMEWRTAQDESRVTAAQEQPPPITDSGRGVLV